MKSVITLFLFVFCHQSFAQIAQIDKDISISIEEKLEFFADSYRIEFCQSLSRVGDCVNPIKPETINQNQKIILVQEAVVRYFQIQELRYSGYLDGLPLHLYLFWSKEKRAEYEKLLTYDFKNQRRFFVGSSSYAVCAGCDDDEAYFEIVYNISKNQLHMNSEYYQGRD